MKVFPDKQNLREFPAVRAALQEMLKGVLQAEIRECPTVNLYDEIKVSSKGKDRQMHTK